MEKGKKFLIIFITIFFNYSCTALNKDISQKSFESPEAYNVSLNLENKNKEVKNFKGIGKIKLKKEEVYQNLRIAWIGQKPNQLRIEVLSITGQPQISVAADGNYFYFVQHFPYKFDKTNSNDANLKDVIFIPVKVSDINKFFTGSVPISNFNFGCIEKNNKINDEYVLVLKSKFGKILQKIYFNKQNQQKKVEIFNLEDVLVYQVEFDNFKDFIPYKLVFSNKKASFEININDFWTNFALDNSTFVLKNLRN